MPVYLSILRGINVGGHRKIVMSDLRALYEGLGFSNVITYIQSGNVIFTNDNNPDLTGRIEQSVFRKYGFQVPVIIRSQQEMQDLLKSNPFLTRPEINKDKLHVTFLSGEPQPADIQKTMEINYPPDEFIISGRHIFLFCPFGSGRSKLTISFFEKNLKLTATTRNWNTVTELAGLMR
ncbi:MAG: DUF1697 domain-containing protein [Bacteroidia bacterium]|nr:DUF1697 domain-containing protein [Bacteroidia bacterium]